MQELGTTVEFAYIPELQVYTHDAVDDERSFFKKYVAIHY